jgi:hypothetical protein
MACVLALVLAAPAAAQSYSFASRALSTGMTGADVSQLQGDLVTIMGYPESSVTGTFSSTTKADVKAFQTKHGLKASGTVGSATFDLLFAELAKHGVSSSNGTSGSSGGGVGLTASASSPSVAKAYIDWAACKTKPKGPLCGLAVPAANTPAPIVEIIEAGNLIAHNAYVYGGGHHYNFVGENYTQGMDCSGSVSWALHADAISSSADLLSSPDDSSGFTSFGEKGVGKWITIYTLPGYHAFMHIAGLWFDTAGPNDWDATKAGGDRWSATDAMEFTTYKVKEKHGKTKTVPSFNWKIRHPKGLVPGTNSGW